MTSPPLSPRAAFERDFGPIDDKLTTTQSTDAIEKLVAAHKERTAGQPPPEPTADRGHLAQVTADLAEGLPPPNAYDAWMDSPERAEVIRKEEEAAKADELARKLLAEPPVSQKESCERCKFFEPRFASGVCRRHAPPMKGFTPVARYEWCGDYEDA